MSEKVRDVIVFMLFLGIVLVAGCGIGVSVCESIWQRECISRGVAEYDAKTAQFKWLVEPKGE